MKKLLTLITVVVLGYNNLSAQKQTTSLFNLELGIGASLSKSDCDISSLYISPRYNLTNDLSVGAIFEGNYSKKSIVKTLCNHTILDDLKGVNFGVNAEFRRQINTFMPFIGLGLNCWGYGLKNNQKSLTQFLKHDTPIEGKVLMGYTPKIGVQWKFIKTSLEYNIVGSTLFESNSNKNEKYGMPCNISLKIAGVLGANYWK